MRGLLPHTHTHTNFSLSQDVGTLVPVQRGNGDHRVTSGVTETFLRQLLVTAKVFTSISESLENNGLLSFPVELLFGKLYL